jgi:hypothetical protein
MKQEKEIPYCTLCLVILCVTSNVCVLVGNLETSGAFRQMGVSAKGWSNVGTSMAYAFNHELDALMNHITVEMTQTVGHIANVTKQIDTMIMIVGQATDASLLEVASTPTLTGGNLSAHPALKAQMKQKITGTMRKVIDEQVGKVNSTLQKVIEAATPPYCKLANGKSVLARSFRQQSLSLVQPSILFRKALMRLWQNSKV